MSTRRCIATTWRLHHVKFHNNAQSQSNLEQNTATGIPYSLVGRVPLGPQNMKQLESGDISLMQSKIRENVNVTALVLHTDTFTDEKILTNDPTHHESKNLTIKEMLAKSDARMQKVEQKNQILSEEIQQLKYDNKTLKEEIRNLKEDNQNLKYDNRNLKEEIQNLKDDKKRRHAGEVVNIRDRLAQLVLSSEENEQRKQQVHDQKDMKANKEVRNSLAHEINLDTTLEQMAIYPDQFDICSITVFGETQNKIRELLTWDKDRECKVYNIFNERGEAWHNQFAKTCIEPFNKWLSAIYALKETESAMLENPSSWFETHIQKQKDGIKEAIREWKETFIMDKSKRGKRTGTCRELIRKDYRDRGLMDHIRATLLHGVVLVKESEKNKKKEESKKNKEGKSKTAKKEER
ncbi:hypothetical protein BCON_0069g00110 [Botryotinia convoluta]|uniref:Uncharacterized protein n=1 Tax=Botryotinia convoluta TaxID=54673 RepID=A0A4Z1IK95_9HELO|nr:hypothetical protein BCON_0069g00110 [Botryotinia convoluta]